MTSKVVFSVENLYIRALVLHFNYSHLLCVCVCVIVRLEVGKGSSPQIITFLLNTQHYANHCEGYRVLVPECIKEDKTYKKQIENKTRQFVFKLNAM